MQHIRSIISVSLAAAVLATLPYELAAASTFPGNNGWIAYGAGQNIKAIDPANGQSRLLAKNARNPRWSPDGQKLAFIDNQGSIQIKTVHGILQNKSAAQGNAIDNFPAWSSDGSRLAFVRTKQVANKTKSAIFTIDSRSLTETNISGWSQSSVFASPSWSPDGTRVVFEKRTGGKRELIIKNLATQQERVVTTLSDDVDSNVSWSPNGKKLLYNDSSNEVYTVWPDGSHRTVISDGESYQAAWSPDGTRIAFLEDPNDESISISGPDGSIQSITITKGNYQTISSPTWSPDGKQLLFMLQINREGKLVSDLFTIGLQQNEQPQKLADDANDDTNWQPVR